MEESKVITPSAFEMQLRVRNCNIDVKKVLDKWNCTIGPIVHITAEGFQFGWEVIPQEVFTKQDKQKGT